MNETIPNEFAMNFQRNPAFFLNEKDAAILRGIFKPKSIRKDDFFLQNGEQSTEIGLVLKGVFRSFYINQTGSDVTKCFYMQGEILLSYYAHLRQTESKYSIQALEDSEILVTCFLFGYDSGNIEQNSGKARNRGSRFVDRCPLLYLSIAYIRLIKMKITRIGTREQFPFLVLCLHSAKNTEPYYIYDFHFI